MSSPKRKVKSAVNQQIKAGLSALKDFLAGRSNDEQVADPEDQATREVVAAELLATMSGRNTDEPSPENSEKPPVDTQEIPRFNSVGADHNAREENHSQETPSTRLANSDAPEPENPTQEQERARQLFLDHGYFDETVQSLRSASSPAERAASARALGLVGSQRATAHLIAAMFDDDAEVRTAAEEALGQIGDSIGRNVPAAAVAKDQIKEVPASESIGSSFKGLDVQVEPALQASELSTRSTEVSPEGTDVAIGFAASVQPEDSVQPMVSGPDLANDRVTDSAATSEEEQLLLKEQTIKEALVAPRSSPVRSRVSPSPALRKSPSRLRSFSPALPPARHRLMRLKAL